MVAQEQPVRSETYVRKQPSAIVSTQPAMWVSRT